MSNSLIDPALCGKNVGKIVVGLRVVPLQAQAFLVFFYRFIKPVLGGKGVAEVAMGAGIARFVVDRVLKVGDGFGKPAFHRQRDAQVIVSVRMVGLLLENNQVMLNRLVRVTYFG